MNKADIPLTFGFVHGSGHGAWCWDEAETELRQQGHRTISMDLPVDDVQADFDDYANVVVDELKDEEDIILVGHSRGCNVSHRAAGRLSCRMLIDICGSFEPSTIGRPTEKEKLSMPVKYSEGYLKGIITRSDGLTVYDPEMARELLYHDCDPEVTERALRLLRPQRRSGNEPRLTIWPDIPQIYIVCSDDRVLNPEWSRYVAEKWLKIPTVEFPSGHSPFLSKPKKLAETLLSLAEQ